MEYINIVLVQFKFEDTEDLFGYNVDYLPIQLSHPSIKAYNMEKNS
jgi:hypothetical protein